MTRDTATHRSYSNRVCTPKVVQERLGYASISTTLDIYSHVSPGLQQAAAMGFDELLQAKRSAQVKNKA